MFKSIILQIVFITGFATVILAQPRNIQFQKYQSIKLLDSLKVDENAKFVLKDRFTNWSHKFDDISYMMVIYEKLLITASGGYSFSNQLGGFEYDRGQLINYTSSVGTVQPVVLPGVNPGDYNVETTANLNKLGKFYFVAIIKGRTEKGNYDESAAYWVVNCTIKTLTTSLDAFNVLDKYYYGQPLCFNFAVQGYDNLKEYSYRVSEGDKKKEIFAGIGSYVSLNFLTENPEMVGKTFVVEGYYTGKVLRFFNPQKSAIDSSVWAFKLVKPDKFQVKSTWMADDEFKKLEIDDVVDALDINEENSRQFKFNYYSAADKTDLVVMPEMKNVKVTSDPPNFLAFGTRDYKIYKEGLWQVLEIIPNQQFFENMKDNEVKKVSLNISFTTQFGEKKIYKFDAYLF